MFILNSDFRFIDGIDKVDSESCLICKTFFFQHKDISYNFFFLRFEKKNYNAEVWLHFIYLQILSHKWRFG